MLTPNDLMREAGALLDVITGHTITALHSTVPLRGTMSLVLYVCANVVFSPNNVSLKTRLGVAKSESPGAMLVSAAVASDRTLARIESDWMCRTIRNCRVSP